MSRAQLGEQLRAIGFAIDDEELQTTGGVAARVLDGQARARADDAGHPRRPRGHPADRHERRRRPDRRLRRGRGAGRVFSYLNLNRAFLELEAGAELYCLHRNRWWQTADGPRLDAGAFVAGLEYAADTEATVLGKPSPEYFAAALEAIDADPELAWMVGDDLEGDVVGAQQHGMRTVLVRTGKFRPGRARGGGRHARRDRLLDRAASRLARAEPLMPCASAST